MPWEVCGAITERTRFIYVYWNWLFYSDLPFLKVDSNFVTTRDTLKEKKNESKSAWVNFKSFSLIKCDFLSWVDIILTK